MVKINKNRWKRRNENRAIFSRVRLSATQVKWNEHVFNMPAALPVVTVQGGSATVALPEVFLSPILPRIGKVVTANSEHPMFTRRTSDDETALRRARRRL